MTRSKYNKLDLKLFYLKQSSVLFLIFFLLIFFSGCYPHKKITVPEKKQTATKPSAEKTQLPKDIVKSPPPEPVEQHSVPLVKLLQEEYPDFRDDLLFKDLDKAINQSLAYLKKIPQNRIFLFGNESITKQHMVDSMNAMLEYIEKNDPELDFNNFIKEKFDVYKSVGNSRGEVLFTGYYEPCLRGSLEKKDEYQYPVFAAPDDLVAINLSAFSDDEAFKKTIMGRVTDQKTVVPYYERKEIGNGDVLGGKAEIIAYAADKIDLFFLEIQGSGILYLDNGDIIKLHYSNKNGRPYRSIGNYMINTGRIPAKDISMQSIKEYLKNNPEEADEVLDFNPSYVFFKAGKDGPFGCYGTEVTAGRSIATDKPLFPACGLAFIITSKPVADSKNRITGWEDTSRLVLNQDTGGAIKGPGRVDLFMGNGPYAELAAGHMKHNGSLYFLVLKDP